MQFSEAKVADILRCNQHDESFIREMQDNVQGIAKLLGARNYHILQQSIPILTNLWFYLMTSLGNLQTLGEEYTGTLRLTDNGQLHSKTAQLLWLTLYIGGDPLYERLINVFHRKINSSKELTTEAKTTLTNILDVLQNEKKTFKQLHHSLFYINGKYCNIANRALGIKYVLVRNWMQVDTYTNSFKILGYFTLFYTLFNFLQQLWSFKNNGNVNADQVINTMEISKKGCVLCAESRRNSCATSCGHVFCWDCIYDSLKYQEKCPICREIVQPSRIIFLQNYL